MPVETDKAEPETSRLLQSQYTGNQHQRNVTNVPRGKPSASSPKPCKKMNVAGLATFLSAASRTKGGFCAMMDGNEKK
jgi:hypothetical protein